MHIGFYDNFIMNVCHNGTMAQSFHGMRQQVTAICLHNILHEFRTIAFDTFPFLCPTDALIGNRLSTETILSNAGFHIGKLSAGRKQNKEHSALVAKLNAVDFRGNPFFDGRFYTAVNIPPELYNIWIGPTPCIHKGLQFFFRKTHIQSTHCF